MSLIFINLTKSISVDRSALKSESGIERLREDGMGGVEDQFRQEDLVAPFIYLYCSIRKGFTRGNRSLTINLHMTVVAWADPSKEASWEALSFLREVKVVVVSKSDSQRI
jgi:hypothetical protein